MDHGSADSDDERSVMIPRSSVIAVPSVNSRRFGIKTSLEFRV